MKIVWTGTCVLAAVSLVVLSPQLSQASPASNSGAATGDSAGQAEAMQMVPGRAAITHPLDAQKLKAGERFKVKLADTVHLKDGRELPHGTTLLGQVASDVLQPGNTKLALVLNKAELKNGMMIPIKATIVGLFPPEQENSEGYNIVAGNQQPNTWNARQLKIDQIGAMSGVDLHSKISGDNSGVFVSTKKDNVKLSRGSELLLAIAPQSQS